MAERSQQSKVFRKAALERLSTPERLDEMMKITSGRLWLALSGLLGLALAALIWGFVGTLPTTVSANGVIIQEGGTYPVPALVGGLVTSVNFKVGDQVTQGQALATVVPLGNNTPVTVKSTQAGTVVELNVDPGSIIDPTTSIATIENTNVPMEAVLYLPAPLGKQVGVGMAAEISPATVSKQNDGYLLGTVTSVAPFPSTPESMSRLLSNSSLVQTLYRAAGGLPLEVHVALTVDPTTPSGFRWSSGKGPNFSITTGTLTADHIVISERHPIDIVLPRLRNLL
jgi:multidrug efflux pump subunit AcrA (membrane-fusion protein)